MAQQYYEETPQGVLGTQNIGKFAHIAGAAVSLALILSAGYWTYKIVSRDVTKIPVVEARSEPMRVAPNDPGGKTAENMDLAVTKIPAASPSEVVDTVQLAPEPITLLDEDMPTSQAVEQAAEPVVETGDTLDLDAVANSLIAGIAPLGEVAPAPTTQNVVQGNIEAALRMALGDDTQPIATTSNSALVTSLRPRVRPDVAVLQNASMVSATEPAQAKSIDANALAAGTALVQFGAFDDNAVAEAEWDRLSGVLSPLLSDRARVIERATSGGRVFYRLRAAGFEDLSDARRFCSAVTNKTACIPVVAR
ncbi:MAG: hypothetical protein RI946_1833 [Pseudomonadota bacterium]